MDIPIGRKPIRVRLDTLILIANGFDVTLADAFYCVG
jgi:hypothetical protein